MRKCRYAVFVVSKVYSILREIIPMALQAYFIHVIRLELSNACNGAAAKLQSDYSRNSCRDIFHIGQNAHGSHRDPVMTALFKESSCWDSQSMLRIHSSPQLD